MAYSNYRSDWNRDRNERWRSGGHRDESRDRDDDDARRARESMERDYYGSESRGGYGGRGEYEDQSSRYGQRYNRGYGQGDYDQDYGQRESGQGGRYTQSGRFSEGGYGRGREYLSSEGRRHHGNEMGGWEGREDEQWRNRRAHGDYDRDADYGGFSSSGTGNYGGYGGSGGTYQGGRGYGGGYQGGGHEGGQRFGRAYQGGQGRWGQAGMQYSQGGYGWPERGRYGESDYGSHGSGRPSGGRAYGDYRGSPSGYSGEDYGGSGSSSQGRGQWSQEQDYGQYRGRGPRGYKRSDDRIREEVCDCLTDDDRLDASNVEVAVKDGEVTLTGSVSSRNDKRWAESLAERISGVKEVQNTLRVQDQQRTQSGASGMQGSGASGATGTSAATGRDKGKESNIQH